MKKITYIVPALLAMSFYIASAQTACPDGSFSPTGVCPKTTTISPSGQGTFPAANDPTQIKNSATVPIKLPNPLGSTQTIPQLIDKIVNFLITIASFTILPAMIVWGAFQILMSAGKPEAVKAGRETITWAVLGYALLLISKGIILIIQEVLSKG